MSALTGEDLSILTINDINKTINGTLKVPRKESNTQAFLVKFVLANADRDLLQELETQIQEKKKDKEAQTKARKRKLNNQQISWCSSKG
jgi:hypothetical protein